jgi:hypothetical protein
VNKKQRMASLLNETHLTVARPTYPRASSALILSPGMPHVYTNQGKPLLSATIPAQALYAARGHKVSILISRTLGRWYVTTEEQTYHKGSSHLPPGVECIDPISRHAPGVDPPVLSDGKHLACRYNHTSLGATSVMKSLQRV